MACQASPNFVIQTRLEQNRPRKIAFCNPHLYNPKHIEHIVISKTSSAKICQNKTTQEAASSNSVCVLAKAQASPGNLQRENHSSIHMANPKAQTNLKLIFFGAGIVNQKNGLCEEVSGLCVCISPPDPSPKSPAGTLLGSSPHLTAKAGGTWWNVMEFHYLQTSSST